MKKYGICMPFTGYRYFEVEADSEDEAREMAWEVEWNNDDIVETQDHEIIGEGNVIHAILNEMSVKLIDETS